jgi:hypothetical protein
MTVELPLLHKQHKQYHGFAEGNYFTFIFNVYEVLFTMVNGMVPVFNIKSIQAVQLLPCS